jgi:hypothetical protein
MEWNSLFSVTPKSRQSRLSQRLSRSNAPPSAPAINDQAPPSYTVADVNPNNLTQDQMMEMARNEKETVAVIDSDVTWAFSQLDIKADKDGFPTPEHCLAHLKLLEAFYALKDEVAYTDGAFSIFDSRAPGTEESIAGDEQATRKRLEALAQIREKRWALFVTRAVDRFEVWWAKMLAPMDEAASRDPGVGAGFLGRLTTAVMTTPQAFENFVGSSMLGSQPKEWTWTADMLPPLGECLTPIVFFFLSTVLIASDVLMVWHAFMLNPRNYLEDCMRWGFRHTLYAGMPWRAINSSIDDHFRYEISQTARDRWVSMTGRAWDNLDDPAIKIIKCPRCASPINIPWTTAAQPEEPRQDWDMKFTGNGYGESALSHNCASCNLTITHDLLRVAKFKRDAECLLRDDYPMGGTVIPGTNGTWRGVRHTEPTKCPHQFPNRLIKDHLRSEVLELCSSHAGDGHSTSSSMVDIRGMIEKSVSDKGVIAKVNGYKLGTRLYPDERLAVRHMMSRYWDNHSLFSLELSGAVTRQGAFVDKMHKIDWLHSPTALATMQRLLLKYDRFFRIMASNPGKMAVPTLDVDLAWHTHQLSPQKYYAYSLKMTRDRFIDHDDKVEAETLSEAFEWTSKEYEKMCGLVYSECTCWYCEAIRAKHAPSSANPFGKFSRHDKAADEFYKSGAADLCPPDNSAHISAHNAVPAVYDPTMTLIQNRLAVSRRKQLDEAYEKACKRAIKRGRPAPKKDEFVADHYGVGYASTYPYTMLYMTVCDYSFPSELNSRGMLANLCLALHVSVRLILYPDGTGHVWCLCQWDLRRHGRCWWLFGRWGLRWRLWIGRCSLFCRGEWRRRMWWWRWVWRWVWRRWVWWWELN